MNFDKNKLALVVATIATSIRAVRMIFFRMFCGSVHTGPGGLWKHHCGFGAKYFPKAGTGGCPWFYSIAGLIMTFVTVFAITWFIGLLVEKGFFKTIKKFIEKK